MRLTFPLLTPIPYPQTKGAELNWQLRGWAGKRQVEGAKLALQHNVGLGGAVVCTLYKKYQPGPAPATYEKRFGYNPVRICIGVQFGPERTAR